MPINLSRIDQFAELTDRHFFCPFYERVNALSKNRRFFNLAAPLVSSADGIASLIQTVGTIGEAGIKGITNLIKGAATCDSIALKRGTLQVLLGAGFIGITSPLMIVFRIVRLTICMAIDPALTSTRELEKRLKQIASYPEECSVPAEA